MTARESLRRGARVLWGALRSRVPAADPAVSTALEAMRTPGGRARTIADLRRRVHELERDQALLAAQVAALGAVSGAADPDGLAAGARLDAARLTAIALYEHRIAALEQRLGSRDTPGRAQRVRTAAEFEGARR